MKKYRLKEYMSNSEEELKQRNTAQISIWKALAAKGLVGEKDMKAFMKFARYFNDYRDNIGKDLTLEDMLQKPHIISTFK